MSASILYRPELRQSAGSIPAAILLQQMLYWWNKSGDKPFYKFKEPCQHVAYKEGDSWTEELGFTRSEFDTALKRLIDKGLVSKKITVNRLTIYTVDKSALPKAEKPLSLKQDLRSTKSGKGCLDIQETTTGDYQKTTNNPPQPEPKLPKALQADEKIVCDKSILQNEKIEKPEEISEGEFKRLQRGLKTIPVKQANQVLQLTALKIKEGRVDTTVERMAGGLIAKVSRGEPLDTSRLDNLNQVKVITHVSQRDWKAVRAESEQESMAERASRAASLANMQKLLGESAGDLMGGVA